MGILYLDEAGNTGLNDTQQKLLIYGGPYVHAQEWKNVCIELASITNKYKYIIASKIQSGLSATLSIERFVSLFHDIDFLNNFHFHTNRIINGKGLWIKLTVSERFDILNEILDVLIKLKITFYIGSLSKDKYKSDILTSKKKMAEYRFLHNHFLKFIESHISENDEIVIIMDEGDISEKKVLIDCLNDPVRNKFVGELICGKHNNYPLLQIADIGIWIFQAYHNLVHNRTDEHANNVRALYQKLESIKRWVHVN